MSLILVVDDIAAMRQQYTYDLHRLGGWQTMEADGGRTALAILESEPVDCVILDLEMPDLDGFQVLAELKRKGDRTPVIVYTGTGSYERCVRAVKLGAYSFLAKDEPLERVVQEVSNALQWARLTDEVRRLRRFAAHDSSLLGDSRIMHDLREQIDRLSRIPSAVLILGESGTGKELVARQLHERGPRAGQPFVAINGAALPENLAESELFGHEKGAFTGADRVRRGAFETAHRGTLLLDEVGELPLAMQAKLLRVLETGKITRVGGAREIAVDTRVLAATNRDLDHGVSTGVFREDLLYRMNVHVLRVPPLRARLEDIPLLIDHFLQTTAARFGRRPKRMLPGAVARLAGYGWHRNNVRELRNVVERLVIASDQDEIDVQDIPDGLLSDPSSPLQAAAIDQSSSEPTEVSGTLKQQKTAAEKAIVLAALERRGWHITDTARDLGLSDHSALLKIMRRHGLKR